ncbi:MAG: dTDP-4-dehydrorhamnose reductase [Gemmatimonadales bacterium]|nr:dTDP-4-dehydrorhamnose reductase [Gemmatimonadales bacterium]
MTSPPLRTALVTGAGGQLGLELQAAVPEGWRVIPCDHRTLDVTNDAQAHSVFERERPRVVINAAAYTAVDAAESEPERAVAVNVRGAANVAQAAWETGAHVIHLSTDFVFDGRQARPYAPGDSTNPLGVYGRSKLEGEREVARISEGSAAIVRSAWIYSARGKNFVFTMLRLMREKESVDVVADQVGTPTWARGLAEAIWAMAARPELRGVHHWTDAGVGSWYDVAVAIQEEAVALGLLDRTVPVRPIRTVDYTTPATRPPYSVLDKTSTWTALGRTPPHWRVNLRLMLQRLPRG